MNPSDKLKEVKFGVRTEAHDLNYKVKHIRTFLDKGHRVKVTVTMHGREQAHPEVAGKMLDTVVQTIPGDFGVGVPKTEGRNMTITLSPARF